MILSNPFLDANTLYISLSSCRKSAPRGRVTDRVVGCIAFAFRGIVCHHLVPHNY